MSNESNDLLGWMGLLLGTFRIVAARIRPVGLVSFVLSVKQREAFRTRERS